jgi:hypothetical protein
MNRVFVGYKGNSRIHRARVREYAKQMHALTPDVDL